MNMAVTTITTLPTDILAAMFKHKVNVQWAGKVVWFSKYDPRVSDCKTATEVYVKLQEGVTMTEVYTEGLRKIGIEL